MSDFDQLSASEKVKVEDAMLSMEEPSSAEEVLELLDKTEKGKPYQTRKNCYLIFKLDPLLRDAFRFNLMTDRVDVVKELGWNRRTIYLSDNDLRRIYLYLEKSYMQKTDKYINEALDNVAEDNAYHPICELLNSLEWDGTERLRYALHHFLGAEVNDYTYECLKLFMLGAVSRIFNPGCKFEVMLCLVGGQGVGKSTFFRFLAIKDEWYSDDLKKLEDENVVRKMIGHWFIEMSEMIATANARSIEDIKSFISRTSETYKAPYAIKPKDVKRQCVFGGTSNNIDFLPLDRSGNRRFLPILCSGEEAEVHILQDEAASREYILQMWAEIMVIYKSGKFKLTLSKELQKHLIEHQQTFMPEDTLAGSIASYLEESKVERVCTKMLYDKALGKDLSQAKDWELREIRNVMNNIFTDWIWCDSARNFPGYGKQKHWIRPQPATDGDGFTTITEAEQMEIPFD